MKKQIASDMRRIEKMTDREIDYSDCGPISDGQIKRSILRQGLKPLERKSESGDTGIFMSNRAIIGVESRGEIFSGLKGWAKRVDSKKSVPEADYYLTFESAALLFAELPPQRLSALEILKQSGSQSIYALAKRLGRNYSSVHRDITKLIDHGLIEKKMDGTVFVPWFAIEIHIVIGKKKAE